MKATVTIAVIIQLLCGVAFACGAFLGLGKIYTPIFCGTLSIIFLVTSIGLLKRQDWARMLTLVLGLILVIGCGITIIFAWLDSSNHAMLPHVLDEAVVTCIGFWWVLTFRSAKARHYFGTPTYKPTTRPTSISVIAILMLMGALSPFMVHKVIAVSFMGMVLEGPLAQLVTVLWALPCIPLGIGLWRLKEWARIGTLVFYGVALVSSIISILDGAHERYMVIARPQYHNTHWYAQDWFSVVTSVVLSGIIFYFLITRRAAFRKKLTNE